ncbi:MAG: nucleotidyltransferase domain-containing protein [Bacteroidetes bacterium]|nr:nucleotidyltransferase domain-containing protein [Bacteroidota bacterium]
MVNNIVEKIKEHLYNQIPGKIKKIILYGSYARNSYHSESDIDILLIMESKIDEPLRKQIYDICYDLNSMYDIWIDISLLSEDDLSTIRGKQPYVQNALVEGIVL